VRVIKPTRASLTNPPHHYTKNGGLVNKDFLIMFCRVPEFMDVNILSPTHRIITQTRSGSYFNPLSPWSEGL
jgi:hypothetical protein